MPKGDRVRIRVDHGIVGRTRPEKAALVCSMPAYPFRLELIVVYRGTSIGFGFNISVSFDGCPG